MDSRLSILMDTFAISGKDLSGLLHIDSSLVSKWRSGKRHLKANSVYTNQIIKHIMDLDRANKYAKIRTMLSSEYANIYKSSENEIALFLKDWLTSSKHLEGNGADFIEEVKNLKNTVSLSTYSVSGNYGRRQAIQFLLKYAQHVSPGAELWIYSTEDIRWFYENKAFIQEWYMRHMTLLKDDNKIRIIHTISNSYENLARSILSWMPMHMTGKTTAYFMPKYKDEYLSYTYLLIKDHLALYNWSIKREDQPLNTYLTHEPQFIKDVEIMLTAYFNESNLIFDRYNYERKVDYINNLVAFLEYKNFEYHCSAAFPIMSLPEDIMEEIEIYNGGFEENDIDNYKLINELSAKSTKCFFIDLDRLRELFLQDEVCINNLSFMLGKKICVSQELFRKIVFESLNLMLQEDNIKLCLMSTELIRNLSDTEIIVKENINICFSKISDLDGRLFFTKELMLVTSIFSYFENLWNTTPFMYRNKEYIRERIYKLIEELE